MSWNAWVRQSHRWVSIAFTAGVIVNTVAVALKRYSNATGLLALVPLFLLLFTGLYLFALPYLTKWRSARRAPSVADAARAGGVALRTESQ